MATRQSILKHPGPGGSEIHSTGTDQSIHSGGLGVSMTEVSRRKLALNLDPTPERAHKTRAWALQHIDRIRSTDNRHESLAGSTIQRLNNLYYTADNFIEEHWDSPATSPRPQDDMGHWSEKTPYGPLVAAITKINRTPDYPHGRSIKWPKVYRGLRRRGMSKEKAARISNAMSNKYRGGSRQPLSRRAGQKPIPEDILDKRPDLRKGQPDMADVHQDAPKPKKKRKGKKAARDLLVTRFNKIDDPEQSAIDEDNLYDRDGISHRTGGRWKHDEADVSKHYGPGPHKNGSEQSAHGRSRDVRGEVLTFDPPAQVTEAVSDWFATHPDLASQELDVEWSSYKQDHDFQMKIAAHYDSLPEYDEAARPSYQKFAEEIHEQFIHLTEKHGIEFIVVEDDPYRNVLEAAEDLRQNSRLKVLATSVTGGHPMISDEINDEFRFVHDIFGHIATGRNFDRHGEEAAFLHHASMFTKEALPAMASETRGQNASLIANREFGPQRAALMEPWAYELNVHEPGKPIGKVDLPKPGFSADVEVAKTDEFENRVFGWASVAFSKDGTQIIDKQGHAIDVADLESMAYNFTINHRKTGDMHQSEDFGEMIESMVFTDEKLKLLGLEPGSIPQGWWVGFEVPPEQHELVRSGKRTMFSIEGTAKLEPYTD